ncbi:MAG: DNA mismatch repair protein MutS [Candidatus Bathyarchaeota archaeon]|nr:DNA mismatch repair protein MutS [Candidatus Bathyarchaeota archaeon]
MSFQSILFDKPQSYVESTELEEPPFFRDLNLNQVFSSITEKREQYNLYPFFSMPLRDVEGIAYRHNVFRDLEKQTLLNAVESFAEDMRVMRQHLIQADKLSYEYQKESWFLDAVEIYCDAVSRLDNMLSNEAVESKGFLAFRDYLSSYVKSDSFKWLVDETKSLKSSLSSVKYCIHIDGRRITVTEYRGETDYGAEVLRTFQKFEQAAVKDYKVDFYDRISMDHVEEQILGLVAQLYPDIFSGLRNYYARHKDYVDPVIGRFEREIQFYLAYLGFINKMKSDGLNFCYPQVTDQSKEVSAAETFDLALANKLVDEHSNIVTNDFFLKNPERIFVVSGPNQGGKTTFARMFGQLHYLAKLGYPVPGREAKLFLFDHLFTHFEREESLENLSGKLQDELIRIHAILEQATGSSIIIVNESFTSAMLKDAIFLGKEVLNRITELDALCVYVTFIDELSTLSKKTVSLVSTIVPENPALRTYKIVRKPADGLAYAIAIAQKYGLTQKTLTRRITK